MTELLVKWFVKDYRNVENVQVRTAYGVLSSLTGIVCNLLLFGVKLAVGAVLRSISVVSDAFNNLSDAASSIISFVGVKMAEKPADKEHPFGHGRVEYIAALIVSFLILEVGWTFLKSSVEKIRTPEEIRFSLVSVAILCLSVGVKLWLAFFNRKLGQRIDSSVMKATAADSLGDVLATGATIVSVLVYGLLHVNIDGYIGLLVSLVVMLAGFNIARETLEPLIGSAIDPEVYDRITRFVESYPGIIGSHDLIVHNYGPARSMASIHAEVPSQVDVMESHELIDRIEREAQEKLGLFLVIHMNPVETDNPEVNRIHGLVEEALRQAGPDLRFHDLRIVQGPKRINVIFDMVVPYGRTAKEVGALKQEIQRRVAQADSRCQCVITVDRAFDRR